MCRFMRATINGGAFVKYAGRFVWLELNTDVAANQPFLSSHPTEGVPDYFILGPASGEVRATWMGSATVAQFERFLVDGEAAAAGRGARPPPDEAGRRGGRPPR